jgi:hypothetical protein
VHGQVCQARCELRFGEEEVLPLRMLWKQTNRMIHSPEERSVYMEE